MADVNFTVTSTTPGPGVSQIYRVSAVIAEDLKTTDRVPPDLRVSVGTRVLSQLRRCVYFRRNGSWAIEILAGNSVIRYWLDINHSLDRTIYFPRRFWFRRSRSCSVRNKAATARDGVRICRSDVRQWIIRAVSAWATILFSRGREVVIRMLVRVVERTPVAPLQRSTFSAFFCSYLLHREESSSSLYRWQDRRISL